MEFSLEGFLKSLGQKEIDELLTAVDKFDPAAYEKREKIMKAVLGFDKAETSIHGENENTVAITTWVDKRNNLQYEMKTCIEIEIYGKGNYKTNWYITTVNEKLYKKAIKQDCSQKSMAEVHKLYRTLFFGRAQGAYIDNPNTDFSSLFEQ